MRMRRGFHALALVCAVAVAVTACGGGDDGDEGSASDSTIDESATTTAEATTTLSPEEAVIADYHLATEAVQAAFDPPNPQHPDLLATHSGAQLERYQSRLAEYQAEGRSDVLVSKETNPRVVSVDDSSAVVEDCLTEVLQYTDTVTRELQGEPRTYTVLIRDELELIDGTWKIVDGRTVEETC